MILIRGDGFDEFGEKVSEANEAEILWHVGNDHWLDNALNRLWLQYDALRVKIDEDADKAANKAQIDFETWRERLSCLNPDAEEAEIEKEAKMLSRIDAELYERVSARFVGQIMPLYTEVTILSAALCEADINLALEWGCAMMGKPELFTLIESRSTMDKWLHGPKLLLADYELPSGSGEAEALARVFRERNRLVHPKALVQVSGKKNRRVQTYKAPGFSDALMWLPRYFSLPFDLTDFLQDCPPINGAKFPVLSHRSEIKRASQHRSFDTS